MLLFDFDGTIADSLPALFECVNNNAAYYGYKKIENFEQFRSKDTHEILKELNLPLFKLYFIINTIRNEMRSKIGSLKPFPGIAPVITELHHQKIPLGIITSNTRENIETFLHTHNLDFFSLIYDKSSIFGKGKILKNLLTTYQLNRSSVIYIGDETRDIEAAQANRVKSAAATWGFNTAQTLLKKNPDYLINKPEELLALAKIIHP